MQLIFFGPERSKTAWIVAGVISVVAVLVIVWQVGVFGDSASALARSADPNERRAAIELLRKRGDSGASDMLSKLANDSDPWTARYAVRALGDHQTGTNQKLLTRMVTDNGLSKAARSEAAATLGKFKDADPEVLTRALAPDQDAEVRAGAAKGLARLEMPKTIPQLSAALEDPSPEVRLWAITAIHRMIVRTYPYDARKPPETQKEVIDRIREYLKKCGVL